jgi:hypothetical protein
VPDNVIDFTINPLDKNDLFSFDIKEENPMSDISDLVDDLISLRGEREEIKRDQRRTYSFKANHDDEINKDINDIVNNYELLLIEQSKLVESCELSPERPRFTNINIDGNSVMRKESKVKIEDEIILTLCESPLVQKNHEDFKVVEIVKRQPEELKDITENENDDSMIINEIIKNSQIRYRESKDLTENPILHVNTRRVGFSDEVNYIGYSDKFNIKNLLMLDAEGHLLRDETKNRLRFKPTKDRDFRPKSIMKDCLTRRTCNSERKLDKSEYDLNRSNRSIGIIY